MGHYANDFGYAAPSEPEGYATGTSVTKTCQRCWAQVGAQDVDRHSVWHEFLLTLGGPA